MDKQSIHIPDMIPVAAKDKTLLGNKLGHLEENRAGLFANKGVLARFYNACFLPHYLSLKRTKVQADSSKHNVALMLEIVKPQLDQDIKNSSFFKAKPNLIMN